MAKTLRVYHGISAHLQVPETMKWPSLEGSELSVSKIQRIFQYAKTIGIQPFEDKRYKAWIHPFGLYDVFNDSTPTDVVIPTMYGSIEMCGINFHETTATQSVVIFGKNSDPLDVKECWISDPSTFD